MGNWNAIRLCLVFIAKSVFSVVASVYCGAVMGASAPPTNRPVALVVAFDDYARPEDDLTHAVSSATELSATLIRLGYRVEFHSNSPNLPSLSDVDKGNIRYHTYVNAEHSTDLIEDWCQRYFLTPFSGGKTDTPFGLIIFTGHGEDRIDGELIDQMLMTPSDTTGEGGVSTNRLKAFIGTHRLPIAMILDCCRTIQLARKDSPARALDRDAERAVFTRQSRTVLDDAIEKGRSESVGLKPRTVPGAIAPVTVIYAAAPTKPAFDVKKNFLWTMNEGLQVDAASGRFIAGHVRAESRNSKYNTDFAPLENETDLSLLSLVNYSVSRSGPRSRSPRNVLPEPGTVDLTMICATTRKNQIYSRPPENLASYLNGFTITGLSGFQTDEGLTFVRNDTADNTNSYATSFFSGQDTVLDWENKTLLIELVAVCPGKGPTSFLPVHLQPGDHSLTGGNYLADQLAVYRLPYGIPQQFQIPLTGNAGQKFKSFALSALANQLNSWPAEARVVVTRMLLLDNSLAGFVRGIAEPLHVDLLSRWWDLDEIPDQGKFGLADERIEQENKPSVVKVPISRTIEGQLSGRGGPIVWPPYVDKDLYELRVSFRNAAAGNKKPSSPVLINLQANGRRLLEKPLKQSSEGTQKFSLEESGFIEYFTIAGQDVTSIEITELSITPKRRGR